MLKKPNRCELDALWRNYEVVCCIFYRNKNQHHRQVWWKYLAMLRQKLRLYFLLLPHLHEEQQKKILMLIPKAYLYFSSIIAQGQFPKLGLVLVTIVASIRNIFWKNEMFQESIQKTNFEDLGEVINIRTFERF
ncbi:uncharacterized protein T551_00578 [Pneumocystis jirovecii RU7]|uniref:RNase MRP protein 1 RNA binding domain-containing protein n=1 Tax=Pneumocystis jirovecii (strain RU7) TaxID=1408657 RepID=A0A0W4ZVT8_PNEJ7|nr:uncharacterized protein T551_00578 [Pneumocystis jirovecii RU7]KTW32488.1 hypothetical protein T551_00578 [Pneumocystis jirovecii RU7]